MCPCSLSRQLQTSFVSHLPRGRFIRRLSLHPPTHPPTLRRTQVCAYSPAHGGRAEGLYDRLLAEGMEVDTFMYLHLVTALGSGGWDQAVGRCPRLGLKLPVVG